MRDCGDKNAYFSNRQVHARAGRIQGRFCHVVLVDLGELVRLCMHGLTVLIDLLRLFEYERGNGKTVCFGLPRSRWCAFIVSLCKTLFVIHA